jgi:hypothetical protein
MLEAKIAAEYGSEKSVPDDAEKEIESAGATDIRHEHAKPAAQASGDRALVLMDLENGMVGWDSAEDPDNPQ